MINARMRCRKVVGLQLVPLKKEIQEIIKKNTSKTWFEFRVDVPESVRCSSFFMSV